MGDNLTAINLGTGRTATAIAAGSNHTCAILDNSSIKCWGFNASGQLGLGDNRTRGVGSGEMGDDLNSVDLGSGRTAKAIAAGNSHTCAILDNSSVKCWGFNASGQLGLGHTDNRGDGSNQMGDNLTAIDLGNERTAKAIEAGGNHTCAILDDASLKCWGSNASGQLGLGNYNNSANPSAVNMGSGITAKAIVAGESHTCAILNNSAIKCWGEGEDGRLGTGKSRDEESPPNLSNDLGNGRTAMGITAGDAHTCAILDNSSIKCWGKNTYGQLGLGDTTNRVSVSQLGDSLPVVNLGAGRTARGITAGDNQTCAILDNASIKCWGANASGQLGLGDIDNRGDNSSEMGDDLPVISL
jgi:alpha-tubulin suppressor-like RCC1 family protein